MTPLEYPPGPHSILPNKLFRQFMRDPIKTLTDIANTYGNICHFKFGRQHIYLLNNSDYIEGILIRDHKNFIKSRGLPSKRLLGEGLVTSEGEYHDRQRRLIQPTFHPNHIKGYGDIITSHAVRMEERWKDGSTLDIHKEMRHVTSEIIGKAVLGLDIKAEEDEVGVALQTCMEYFNRLHMPFGELIEKIAVLPLNKGYQSAKKKLDSIVYGMIKEHRDNESKGVYHEEDRKIHPKNGYMNKPTDVIPVQEDLLYSLLQAQDTEAGIGRMTDLQLKDEVTTIFL
jgi:cytochrome P450